MTEDEAFIVGMRRIMQTSAFRGFGRVDMGRADMRGLTLGIEYCPMTFGYRERVLPRRAGVSWVPGVAPGWSCVYRGADPVPSWEFWDNVQPRPRS